MNLIIKIIIWSFMLTAFPSIVISSEIKHFYGIGTNANNISFILKITLNDSNLPVITGKFDATGFPESDIICGKGNYNGTLNNQSVSFSLINEDDDPGCGVGGQLLSINAELSEFSDILEGSYEINNGEQVTFKTYLAEKWIGNGINDTFSIPWEATLYMTDIPDNKIAGEFNATEGENTRIICGSGIFIGTRNLDDIDFSFTSNDPDFGCGFDRGLIFTFTGITTQEIAISGDYFINNQQNGRWDVILDPIFSNNFE